MVEDFSCSHLSHSDVSQFSEERKDRVQKQKKSARSRHLPAGEQHYDQLVLDSSFDEAHKRKAIL